MFFRSSFLFLLHHVLSVPASSLNSADDIGSLKSSLGTFYAPLEVLSWRNSLGDEKPPKAIFSCLQHAYCPLIV